MDNRLKLHSLLSGIEGVTAAYFQPPIDVSIKYPCIVYELSEMTTRHADNLPYLVRDRYSVTVIDKNPDSQIPKRVAGLPSCRFTRRFSTNNLYHTVFDLYF